MSDDKKRIEELEYKIGQAYQVIGALLAEPGCKNLDFDSPEGERLLDYFAHAEYDDDFSFIHPGRKSRARYLRRYRCLPRRCSGVYRPSAGPR